MKQACLVYVTYPSKKHAQQIIEVLLKEKIIACATLFPVQSSYVWKESIVHDDEYVSIIKTTEEQWNTVQKRITELHTYDVPCIIKIHGTPNTPYLRWLYNETHSNA